MSVPTPSPIPKLRQKIASVPSAETSDRVKQLATPEIRPFLDHHLSEFSGCTACELHCSATQRVFYRGFVPADILFLADAPGNGEDAVGRPLVGRTGMIMDSLLNDLADFWRETFQQKMYWCITNTVCCRPPVKGKAIRQPKASEADACSPRLRQFIQLVRPKIVVLMGTVAQRIWGVMDTDFYTGFPPYPDWPTWGQKDNDIAILDVLHSLHQAKGLEAISDRLQAIRAAKRDGRMYTPHIVSVAHPGTILSAEDVDRPTEYRRLFLTVSTQVLRTLT
jgi:uracil-DNA glycosylase family 4